MPTNYTGRVVLILLTLWAALSLIFPSVPGSGFWVFHPTQKVSLSPNLKPGIDMVGGTSLLYEIKQPEGGYHGQAGHTLAEDVMESLKKRVDPDGVRNLIWRPQGQNRLEIQMPLTGNSENAKDTRKKFDETLRKLNETNVRISQVTDAIEKLTGDARRDRINELSMGSKKRAEIFGAMASVWDQIQQARQAKNASLQADKEEEYDNLKNQIDATNIRTDEFENALDAVSKDPAKYTKVVEETKAKFPDFPARQTALDEFSDLYKQYLAVKGSIDDAGDLKRLLKGSGVLDFHILVDDPNSSEVMAMRERLPKSGPRPQAGETTS